MNDNLLNRIESKTNVNKDTIIYDGDDILVYITDEFLGSNKNTINTFLNAVNSDLELIK